MKCPHCDTALLMAERKGIEIDYCSNCRGVWLDKGELDKIIEYSIQDQLRSAAPNQTYNQPSPNYSKRPKEYPSHGHYQRSDYKYKKKKNLLSELFDIF